MVGSAVCRRLAREPGVQVLTASRDALDLTDADAVADFMLSEKPDAVIFAAARVGGIVANRSYPVEFLSDNVRMATASIEGARSAGVQRFLFLGSTCIYPRDAVQPVTEQTLLTGPLESTNEAYALAKIVGLKLCQYMRHQFGPTYHSAIPTNLYGPGDNYHPEHSHVLPALIRRLHEAHESGKDEVVIWGTGSPRRELLHVDDLADALVHLVRVPDPPDWVNVGTGEDATILEIAQMVAEVVGYQGRIKTDPSRPDGTPRKVTDVTQLHALGWHHQINFRDGLASTYAHFLDEIESNRLRVG